MLVGVVSAALELGEIKAILTAKMIEATTMRRVIDFIVYLFSAPTHTSTLQPSATALRYDPN
jgi:hypothetical protein